MARPVIADNKPASVDLEAGEEYYFCTCGRSAAQPFCDGSHVGTGFEPHEFAADEDGEVMLCQCKHTGMPPFCDGTHAMFGDDDVGVEAGAEPGDAGKSSAADPAAPAAVPDRLPSATVEEPTLPLIHQLAREGLSRLGHHGPMGAMGVPRPDLPHWDDIQIMVAQLARKPLLDEADVGTDLVVGPEAARPLSLDIPIIVSDMSFGSLSEEAKIAMATGADRAGTGICSGEGGMLPEEQQANGRYFYELASARFGYAEELLTRVQAFHFKAGQAAKTGTGGHLPAAKNVGKISQVRGIPEGTAAISPAAFTDLTTPEDFARLADRVREVSGGIPVGFKMSANHVEEDVDFALAAGADYIIVDGRGGGTGAAPLMFRDHISVPLIAALPRARRRLDERGASGRVTLFATGGVRVPSDFVKALALGADGIAIANSAMQAIGCIGARICNSNNCPVGIATQKPELRARLNVEEAAGRLHNFLVASVELMAVMARACGHDHLGKFTSSDLATWDRDMACLAGIEYAGVHAPPPPSPPWRRGTA